MRIIGKLIGLIFKLIAILLLVGTPLLGVWVSSSIAIFANEGLPWAIGAGLLMFPVLPVLWELWAAHRRKRKGKTGRRILNGFDRIVLRTVFLNGIFLAGLLATQPKAAFTALSARGDWMLAGSQSPTAEKVRKVLFGAADRLAWLYEAASDNPYKDKDGSKPPTPGPIPPPLPDGKTPDGKTPDGKTPDGKTPDGKTPDGKTPDGKTPDGKTPDGKTPDGKTPDTPKPAAKPNRGWPQPTDLHPIVRNMPASAEKSPAAVGRYIASQSKDEFVRARAIHDYVADRIAYDAVALAAGRYPPYQAKIVLERRKGVCAGYAKLYVAIAKAAGLEAAYLTGHARDKSGGISGIGHAWNAVKVEGRWYLLDATWDSGTVKGPVFTKTFRTSYYMTPPEIFGMDHFPDDPRWQLRASPLSRGDFIRQPFMRVDFHAVGLKLISPRRPQVSTGGQLTIRLQAPVGTYLLLRPQREGGGRRLDQCKEKPAGTFDCRFPQDGKYTVHICYNKKARYGTYSCVGKVLVNASL